MSDLVRLSDAFADNDVLGLVVTRHPTWDEYEGLGAYLRTADKKMAWLIGDWVNLGEQVFGEQAAQALDPDGPWSEKTLAVYSWVCRSIAPERRRRELDFAHHQIVAALPPADQDKWLESAASDPDGIWSTRELSRAIKEAATGKATKLWVLVSATDPQDAEWLVGKLMSDGRAAKVVER